MQDIHVQDVFVQPSCSNHAELPLWDEEEQVLLWVDMEPTPFIQAIRNLDTSSNKRIRIPDRDYCTGCFLQRGKDKHEIILGNKYGLEATKLSCQDARIKSRDTVADIRSLETGFSPDDPAWQPIRLNEATVDPRGRIWFATCAEGQSPIKPALYLFDPATKALDKIQLDGLELNMSNAMVFSPDAAKFYLGCSIGGSVWQFHCDLDAEDPQKILSQGKEVIKIEKPAVPDGMTCDSEGRLYLAVFNSGKVNVYGPDGGEPLYAIHVPAQAPTCTAFAGANLDELIVTTHAVNDTLRQQVLDAGVGSAEELNKRWPDRKGGIYKVKLSDVRGLAQYRANALA